MRSARSRTGCSDNGSGVKSCNGSSGNSSSASNLTSSTTFTVEDNVGHTNTCSVDITATTQYSQRTRSIKTCTCYGKQKVNTGCTDTSPCTYDGTIYGNGSSTTCYCYKKTSWQCTQADPCGYTDWSEWSGWSTGNYCDSDTCESTSRVIYS